MFASIRIGEFVEVRGRSELGRKVLMESGVIWKVYEKYNGCILLTNQSTFQWVDEADENFEVVTVVDLDNIK
jgi:hypothetical protein